MTPARVDLADIHAPRRLAQELHRLLGPSDGAVPIVEIARALDICEVRLDNYDGFEGMLLTDARRSVGGILANTRYGRRRARFTVGHELGHFLLERHVLSDEGRFRCQPADLREIRLDKIHARQETEANTFASEVLAPVAKVKPFLSDELDIRTALAMRDQLDISLEVTLRRMIFLSTEPIAAVWSANGRVRYSACNRSFPYIKLAKGSALPQTTSAFRAVTTGARGTTAMTRTHSLAWTSRANLELREQTRVGKNNHAVTLLWADLPDGYDADDEAGLREIGSPGFR